MSADFMWIVPSEQRTRSQGSSTKINTLHTFPRPRIAALMVRAGSKTDEFAPQGATNKRCCDARWPICIIMGPWLACRAQAVRPSDLVPRCLGELNLGSMLHTWIGLAVDF